MFTFLISVCLLILGYIFYGKLVEKAFSPDPQRTTPAVAKADGVDFIVMPSWKIFMIQFLNIAGTGPIFGAILGAKYGPACYLWIVLGCMFGGAVHDYLSGMMSLRMDGAGLPEIIGKYLGRNTKIVLLFFIVLLLILVGAVFVYSPALILGDMTGGSQTSYLIWIIAILTYYMIATMVPIDKIIGKIYPLFAFAIIFMALGLFACLVMKWPGNIPEIWDGLQNRDTSGSSIFPCMFITIACGAVSGFHATQSPLMAKCMKKETLGRPIFYGSMITEGIVALIWATISSYFFFAGGQVEMNAADANTAPEVVTTVATQWLGKIGGILAILGVVAAPITTGDTALRSARLIIAEAFKLDQKPIVKRFMVCIPLFFVVGIFLWYNISDENGFNNIWRYFGWGNQTISVFTFWAITVYLYKFRKGIWYIISLVPATFMTSVCITFISTQKIGFGLPEQYTPFIALGTFIVSIGLFLLYAIKKGERVNEL